MDDYVIGLAIAALVLLFISTAVTSASRDAKQQRILAQLTRLEHQTKLIMEHLGIEEVQPEYPEVAALLVQGKKIQAIKVYREQTGVGLKEAKDAVERMM